jgi:formylmethanofuran dehydrogenase subunit E
MDGYTGDVGERNYDYGSGSLNMLRWLSFLVLFGVPSLLPVLGLAEDRLPVPDYHRQPSDPEWLAQIVQFHGHLGPSVVAGARIGMMGLRAVEAKGFFDVEVTCEGPLARPPASCFLDGLQAGTGATLGKRTLRWTPSERIVVRIKNTRTGKTAELRPTVAVVGTFVAPKSAPKAAAGKGAGGPTHEQIEAAARKIASMPEKEIAEVTVLKEKETR